MGAQAAPAGAVDWKGAEAYMRRGEGEEGEVGADAGANTESEVREFRYRGKTLRVDAATHEVLEGLRREARGANGRLGSELARTREQLARLEGRVAAAPAASQTDDLPPEPDPMLATRDIAAWQRQMAAHQDAKLERRLQAIEARKNQELAQARAEAEDAQRQQAWADRFYQEYDHLDHNAIKPVVLQAYLENRSEIDALREAGDTAGSYDRLAELADDKLVQLKNAGKDADTATTPNRRPPRLESTAGATPRGKTNEAPPREFSAASWAAKARLRMTGQAVPNEK